MKSLSAQLTLTLIVLGLTIHSGEAPAAEWKEFAEATSGVFHYDAASMSTTPGGLVRVWIYNVTKQATNLLEFNCKKGRYHVLDDIKYDEASHVKSRETYYNNPADDWYDIVPKSVPEALFKIVCP